MSYNCLVFVLNSMFCLCYSELQRIILELVALLARYNVSPKELSLYLSLFKSENPPLVSISI
jgi:hypothetical protein